MMSQPKSPEHKLISDQKSAAASFGLMRPGTLRGNTLRGSTWRDSTWRDSALRRCRRVAVALSFSMAGSLPVVGSLPVAGSLSVVGLIPLVALLPVESRANESTGNESTGNASAQSDATQPDPAILLSQMADALETLNYEGVFVHMYNGNVETMRILHSHDGRGVRERLISLNGEAREVFRNNKLVTCIWPGSQSVIVSQSKPRDLFPKVNEAFTQSDFYQFELAEDDRVAGVSTWVVNVKPKDNFRYGYRFWIDKQNNMLLRSILTDSEDQSLEQILFTDIKYPDSFRDDELEADTDSRKGYTWVDTVKKPDNGESVSFAALPGGYEEVSETYYPMPMNDTPYSHVMLSDGMASVSVYVEYIEDESSVAGNAGVSTMGAVNAYGRSMGQAFVMVVGEVPVSTVKSIGDSVKVEARSN